MYPIDCVHFLTKDSCRNTQPTRSSPIEIVLLGYSQMNEIEL